LGRKGGSYKFAKRQKELQKQKKKQAKLERQQKKAGDPEGVDDETPVHDVRAAVAEPIPDPD
jgi:hypothetical protein